ncbi:YadA C-terminal domain-containing protein [Morganella morganii]|uniref:YadA C-terminal domain-containing protein n=1 Tax=Morganella morganii TaxID=582 RepID=UPI001C4726EB|nr:YadA-like family protein [Morganella morganii]QXO65833.1 YadA-like family protein [Morganella morganii]
MKKSILALIISPLFIHSANANMKPFTEVTPHGFGSGTLFEFAEKKTDGDRAVGVSEIEQVTTGLGQFILENYEYVDDVRKDSSKKAAEQDGRIAQVHQTVTDTSGRVNTLEKKTEFLENKTQAMDAQLDITARKAEHNNTLIGTFPGMIKQEIETQQNYVNGQITSLRSQIYSNEYAVRQEQEHADSAKVVTRMLLDATDGLETDVDKLKNKVLAVELQAGFAKDSAYTSEKDIRENKNQLSTQSRDIAKNKKLLESAKVVTTVLADATLALEGDVDKLNTRISNASKKINTTTNIANQNTRDIAQQKVKVEKNTLDILKNRQDLRSLENDLRETNERLDNGLAANAALNGLFQPYGVGKLNITAAVGGYQSTQAVAVGTGYRFNENIAVKTGMAYTGSNDVMYNMAVNLEW